MVQPVRYMPGEVKLSNEEFHWPEFYLAGKKAQGNVLDANERMVENYNLWKTGAGIKDSIG